MRVTYAILVNNKSRHVICDEPTECPVCKHAIKPVVLAKEIYFDEHTFPRVAVTYHCTHCFYPFLGFFQLTGDDENGEYETRRVFLEPNYFIEEKFDPKITAISPHFSLIYNQSLAAEADGLDLIAGIGYRKAVEFLVKDFCIHQHPDDSEKIKRMPLGKVIDTYVDNPQIKSLATGTVWIGNDETHYVRKHEDRDINDMKTFIKAMVYFVGMVLITEDASSMSPA